MNSSISRRRARLGTILCLLVFAAGCARSDHSSVLQSAEAAHLAAANPDNYGRPVQLQGVVTYYDPEWHLLFLQDSSGGFFISVKEDVPGLAVGRTLEVIGKLAPSSTGIEDPQFRLLGAVAFPVPQRLPEASDPYQARLSQWIKIRGIVHSSAYEDGRLTLTVVDGSRRTKARILDRKKIHPISLLGAQVSVTGVSGAVVDDKGNLTGIQVFVPSADNVKVESALKGDPFFTRPDPFSAAFDRTKPGSLLHLVGTVAEQKPGGALVLTDGPSKVSAQLSDFSQFAPGDCVELLGFTSSSSAYQVEDAIVRLIAPRIELNESQVKGALRSIRELKSLSVEAATRQIPVNLRATVTFVDLFASILFVQDSTAGAYVNIHSGSPELHLGDIVHIQGFSGPGDYAPVIVRPSITVVGHGPLPKPQELSLEALASGNSDGGWVQITGIVRSVSLLESQHVFKLAVADNTFDVQLPRASDTSSIQDHLLDSQVRIRAICGTVFNERRQLIGLKFFLPDTHDIQIVGPAPVESAARPIASLLRFDPQNLSLHRVKVRGVVTLQDSDHGFYLQDSSGAIYVVTEQVAERRPGETVEVSGFPVAGADGPSLEDATVSLATAPVSAVVPLKLTPEELSTGSYNSQLVSIEGQLLEQITTSDQDTMLLRAGQLDLRVRLQGANVVPRVRRNSSLEVTGVLQPESRSHHHSFRISLRTPGDIRVLQAASWWTAEHTARALAVAVIAILAVLLWVAYSAYRVRSHQARHDPLTGLQNRGSALEYLERQLARAIREGSSIGIILADVDHFKRINDTYGHLAGDAVLTKIASILAADLRPYDAVGRYGGDEFLIIVPNCDAATARDVAERIRQRILKEDFAPILPPQALPVTSSFGIALASGASWNVDSILASADRALYAAKNSGRNALVIAPEQKSAAKGGG